MDEKLKQIYNSKRRTIQLQLESYLYTIGRSISDTSRIVQDMSRQNNAPTNIQLHMEQSILLNIKHIKHNIEQLEHQYIEYLNTTKTNVVITESNVTKDREVAPDFREIQNVPKSLLDEQTYKQQQNQRDSMIKPQNHRTEKKYKGKWFSHVTL